MMSSPVAREGYWNLCLLALFFICPIPLLTNLFGDENELDYSGTEHVQ